MEIEEFVKQTAACIQGEETEHEKTELFRFYDSEATTEEEMVFCIEKVSPALKAWCVNKMIECLELTQLVKELRNKLRDELEKSEKRRIEDVH